MGDTYAAQQALLNAQVGNLQQQQAMSNAETFGTEVINRQRYTMGLVVFFVIMFILAFIFLIVGGLINNIGLTITSSVFYLVLFIVAAVASRSRLDYRGIDPRLTGGFSR